MGYSVKYNFFMSQLTHIEDLKETEKTKISIVYHEGLKSSCILRVCKNRDLSSVCNSLRQIRNPNTVVVHDYVYENGDTYILEENVDGDTITEILENRGTLSEQNTAKIIVEVCKALEELHQKKPPVVHNDINPSNIKIREDGSVKLFDFDISRIFKKGQSQNTVLFGTEEYASPEHYGWGQTTPCSDIYSLGVTMHKMLTRKCLSDEKKMTYGGKLKDIIEKCIYQEPEKRYQSAAFLRFDLEKYLNNVNNKKKNLFKIIATVFVIMCLLVTFLIYIGTTSDNKNNESLNASTDTLISAYQNTDADFYGNSSSESYLNTPDFTSSPQSIYKNMENKYELTGELRSMAVLNDGSFVYLEEKSDGCYLISSFGKEFLLKNCAGSYTSDLVYDNYSGILYLLTRDMNASAYELYSFDEKFNTLHLATLNAGDRTISGTYYSNLYASFFSDATMYCDVLDNQFVDSKNWSDVSSINFSVFSIINDKLYQLNQNDTGENLLQEIDFQNNVINEYEIPFEIEEGRWRGIIYNNNKNIFFEGKHQNKDYIYKFDGENFKRMVCLSDYKYYSSLPYGEWCVTSDAVYIHDTESNVIREFKFK